MLLLILSGLTLIVLGLFATALVMLVTSHTVRAAATWWAASVVMIFVVLNELREVRRQLRKHTTHRQTGR